jgi:4-hydroxybenzoate polyprenyltransferase
MLDYLKIYRPLNLFFMGLAQFFCAYYLDRFATLNSVISNGLFWLVIGTISCASFGYWINDYYDQERDIQNKKRPSYIAKLAPITVYIHLIIFVFAALLSGYFMGSWFLILFIFSVLMLFMYSWRLKDIPVIGNVIISLLSFYSIYSIIMLTSSVDGFLILHFSVFSGLVTFCREIIKDIEDMEGDKNYGSKTLPIVFGIKIANNIAYLILLFLISMLIFSYSYQSQYFQGVHQYLFYAYCLIFIVLPLYKVAIDLRHAQKKSDYTHLSLLMKYIIFTGIFSILFF